MLVANTPNNLKGKCDVRVRYIGKCYWRTVMVVVVGGGWLSLALSSLRKGREVNLN